MDTHNDPHENRIAGLLLERIEKAIGQGGAFDCAVEKYGMFVRVCKSNPHIILEPKSSFDPAAPIQFTRVRRQINPDGCDHQIGVITFPSPTTSVMPVLQSEITDKFRPTTTGWHRFCPKCGEQLAFTYNSVKPA